MSEDNSVKSKVYSMAINRLDSVVNYMTGMRTSRDKASWTEYGTDYSQCIDDQMLENAYCQDPIAARVVEAVPNEAMRKGWHVLDQKDKARGDIKDFLAPHDFWNKLKEAWTWSELFGGSALVFIFEGAGAQDTPLDPERITGLTSILVLDRRRLEPAKSYPLNSIKPMQPETFRVVPLNKTYSSVRDTVVGGRKHEEIHESRMLLFHGLPCPAGYASKNEDRSFWGISQIERGVTALKAYQSGIANLETLLHDQSQVVVKIRNLVKMLAADSKESIRDRLSFIDQTRSNQRAVAMDAEYESFERHSNNLGGWGETIDVLRVNLSAVYAIPVTRLFGISPAGLNATGDYDLKNWREKVEQDRARVLVPKLEKVAAWIAPLTESRTKLTKITIELPPLEVPSEAEFADLRLKTAQADAIYLQNQVVFPEEVALARSDSDNPFDLVIETQVREEILKADLETAREEAKEPKEVINAPNLNQQESETPETQGLEQDPPAQVPERSED